MQKSISFSVFIYSADSASMLSKVNAQRRSCPIVVRKSFLMRRNFEKDCSAVASVAGKVRNRSRADTTSVTVEVSAAFSTISR